MTRSVSAVELCGEYAGEGSDAEADSVGEEGSLLVPSSPLPYKPFGRRCVYLGGAPCFQGLACRCTSGWAVTPQPAHVMLTCCRGA